MPLNARQGIVKKDGCKSQRTHLENLVFGQGFHDSSDDEADESKKVVHSCAPNEHNKGEAHAEASDSTAQVASDSDSDNATEPDADVNDCVWRDSDDDDEDLTLRLDSQPKIRKLRTFGNPSCTDLTPHQLQQRLRRFKIAKTGANEWVTQLRQKSVSDKEGYLTDDEDEEDTAEHPSVAPPKAKKLKVSNLLRSSTRILGTPDAHPLRPGTLQYRLLPDLNRKDPSQSAVTSCGFISGTETFFTTGLDKTIRLFRTSTLDNDKSASYHIKGREIRNAFDLPTFGSPSVLFLAGIRSVGILDVPSGAVTMLRSFSAARRFQRFFQICPGPSGQFAATADNGHILCCDVRMQAVASTFKMNAEGHSLTYLSNDDNQLFTGDSEGTVYNWDLRTCQCVRTFRDEGSQRVTALASISSSFTSSYLAVGSSTGYVNIYDISRSQGTASQDMTKQTEPTSFFDLHESDHPAGPWPSAEPATEAPETKDPLSLVKSLGHLTTSVTSLAFHPSSNLLVMASKFSREGVKLVHLPSFTVFSNFPRQDKSLNLKYPECIAFNSSGSSLVIGNSHGLAKHFELHHFLRSTHSKKSKV